MVPGALEDSAVAPSTLLPPYETTSFALMPDTAPSSPATYEADAISGSMAWFLPASPPGALNRLPTTVSVPSVGCVIERVDDVNMFLPPVPPFPSFIISLSLILAAG